MRKNNIRVVIDTNIWIGFLIGKTLSGLSEAISNDNIRIIFSKELFDELFEVLQRPKFNKYFSQENIKELISLLHSKTERIEITEHFKDCRDLKDNFILDLCVSGNADYLVTGDDDLLALNPFRGTKIVNYRLFREIYGI
jgi:putative PIN family toxin of toxin-antitoxin system